MPPPQASVPPPPAMFGTIATQMQQMHHWPTAWQWIPQAATQPLAQPQPRDLQFSFPEEMSGRNNFIKRERFNNNRHNNLYVPRGNFHRKNNRRNLQQRFDAGQNPYERLSYFKAAINQNVDWPKSTENISNRVPGASARLFNHLNVSNAAKQENSVEQEKKEETGAHKKNKPRKPMSVSYPSRPWNREDAEKALKTENEHNRSVRAQSLIIKFPDPELNKDVVRNFHSGIQNIHFQSPSGARYCFVQMKEGTNIDESIKELEKIKFGCGYLKVERKSLRDEDNPVPQEIDPYTLYIGNLPESLNVNEVKNQFPTAVRVDVGYAQKMRNTRYAFIRYNTVDESIAAYKSAHSVMWDGRSIIVRFRRQRGHNCPNEPKTSPKIKNEAAKVVDHDSSCVKIIEKTCSEIKEKHITPSDLKCTDNNPKKVTQSLVKSSVGLTEKSNQLSRSSQEPVTKKTAVDSTEDSEFITEIKEEPEDYEDITEMSIEEEDDEDDEGVLYTDVDYLPDYDESIDDNMSSYKEEFISDKSSDEDVPPDNLDTVFKDLVNTAYDIGVHDK